MQKLELLYEGKAKRIYRTESADMVWVEYKDSATAFNREKRKEEKRRVKSRAREDERKKRQDTTTNEVLR